MPMALIVVLLVEVPEDVSPRPVLEKPNCVSRNFSNGTSRLFHLERKRTRRRRWFRFGVAQTENEGTRAKLNPVFREEEFAANFVPDADGVGWSERVQSFKIGEANAKALRTARRTDSHTPSRETPQPIFCFVPSVLPPDEMLPFELLLSVPLLAEETNALEEKRRRVGQA